MLIRFSPQRSDNELTLAKTGDVLTINGEDFDFSPIPEGATLPAAAISSPFVVGDVTRDGNEISLTLILPHGPNPPFAVAFPDQLTVTEDGPITLPGAAAEETGNE